MSHCLSNLPIFCQRINTNNQSKSLSLPFSYFLIPNNQKSSPKTNIIKAVSGNGRDNLDHLQRAGLKTQNQQPQPPAKRRSIQSPPIGLWDRFPTARTVQQMMDTMERLMEEPLASNAWGSPETTNGYRRGRTPWEIKEGEEEYKVRFDMPGMTREDVKVWVEEKMLVLKAEKEEKKKKVGEGEASDEGEEWSAKSYGKYNFRIALPDNIQFEKIKAEVKDGVLYVTIPKAPTASKVLDINVQ